MVKVPFLAPFCLSLGSAVLEQNEGVDERCERRVRRDGARFAKRKGGSLSSSSYSTTTRLELALQLYSTTLTPPHSYLYNLPTPTSSTMPRAAKKQVAPRHDPLAVQMHTEGVKDTGVLSQPGKRQKRQKTEQADEVQLSLPLQGLRKPAFWLTDFCCPMLQTTLDAKVSRKVLSMARDQQDELAAEDVDELDQDVE